MKIAIVGAGPAGLYAAIGLKSRRPDLELRLFERNPRDATFGFGVVFSDEALAFLRGDDPETCDLITPRMQRWNDIEVVHRGQSIVIDGVGFSAIGRLELLRLLQERAAALGIHPAYECPLDGLDAVGDSDLIVGADGVNSLVRGSNPQAFGQDLGQLSNRFVWYGATRPFERLTQTFVDSGLGRFNAHHYRYSDSLSTFIVECGAETWQRAGFAGMSEEESRRTCEGLFAKALQGANLVTNMSLWRNFPLLANSRWFDGNRVLVGDALHTAHFSIGSGTRLALEDVIALVRALEAHDFDPTTALPAYQAARQPVLDKIVAAAGRSAAWYEDFGRHMDLEPWPFALSYILRSGRLDRGRLAGLAPRFTAELDRRGLLEKAP